jgi:hypothetical protein
LAIVKRLDSHYERSSTGVLVADGSKAGKSPAMV